MKASRVLVALVLLVGGAVVALVTWATSREPAAPSTEPHTAVAAALPPSHEQSSVPQARAASERERATTRESAAVIDAARARGRRLRIVDENGHPVAGAEYFCGPLPYARPPEFLVRDAARELWSPTDAWLSRECTVAIADADGFVTSRTNDVPWLFMARVGDRLAFWEFPFPAELRFLPERSCDVTVVDTHGAPLTNAAIVLGNEETEIGDGVVLGETDEHGRCRVRRLEWLSTRWPDGTHRIGVRGLGVHDADVAIDTRALPSRLTLVVPPCGTVAVEVVDAAGRRMRPDPPITLYDDRGGTVTEFVRDTESVVFGHCALGAQIAIAEKDGRRIAGPSRAGEHVVVRITPEDLAPGGHVLTGRALHGDGRPLVRCSLETNDTFFSSCTTDDDGRFVFVRRRGSEVPKDPLEIVQTKTPGNGTRTALRGAVVPLRTPLAPGHTDLGNVRLEDAQLRVRGAR